MPNGNDQKLSENWFLQIGWMSCSEWKVAKSFYMLAFPAKLENPESKCFPVESQVKQPNSFHLLFERLLNQPAMDWTRCSFLWLNLNHEVASKLHVNSKLFYVWMFLMRVTDELVDNDDAIRWEMWANSKVDGWTWMLNEKRETECERWNDNERPGGSGSSELLWRRLPLKLWH